jgi:hypothetical protein
MERLRTGAVADRDGPLAVGPRVLGRHSAWSAPDASFSEEP